MCETGGQTATEACEALFMKRVVTINAFKTWLHVTRVALLTPVARNLIMRVKDKTVPARCLDHCSGYESRSAAALS
jgi:hypothetical protein